MAGLAGADWEYVMKTLYRGMNKISDIICWILSVLIVAIVVLNAGSVFLQVINRYIIVKVSKFSFPGTDEISRYSMIWLCYVALPIVYREGAMAQLDLIFERIGKNGKMALYILTRILCIIFIVIAVYYGFFVVKTRMVYKTPIMRIPGPWLYSAPIFGCVLTCYEIVTEMVGVLAGELEPFYGGRRRLFHGRTGGDES